MTQFSISRSVDIHYAHRVPKHKGKCATLHGHRGVVEVILMGDLATSGPDTDMVIDFHDIEAAIDDSIKGLLCHRTLLWKDDPLVSVLTHDSPVQYSFSLFSDRATDSRVEVVATPYATCVLLPFVPTAERLAQLCFRLMVRRMEGSGVRVEQVRFWETAKSMAAYPGVC